LIGGEVAVTVYMLVPVAVAIEITGGGVVFVCRTGRPHRDGRVLVGGVDQINAVGARSAADISIDDVAEPLPGLALEPHHLHLRNWSEVSGRRVDLDARQETTEFEIPEAGGLLHHVLAREIIATGLQYTH
jgi:hypothetical protein